MREKITSKPVGSVEIQVGGRIFAGKNLVVDQHKEILALAIAGKAAASGMYFLYDNVSPVVPPSKSVGTRADHLHTAPFVTSSRGFVRAPSLVLPQVEALRSSFFATAIGAGAVTVAGNELTPGLSKFYGAALVSLAPELTDDLLFSVIYFADFAGLDDEIEKVTGRGLSVTWHIDC